jgi:ADP-ribosyl-[dinitrogen reductase] hydrolase
VAITGIRLSTAERLNRAQGCLLGQLAGDSLGSLVEFESEASIAHEYPQGVRLLANGGSWNTLAGQPTDDSEMALMLARSIIAEGGFNVRQVKSAYRYWMASEPFDYGNTIKMGLADTPLVDSQANGALMRVSPLGIFGAGKALEEVEAWARADARITHPNAVCEEVSALFAMAIATAVETDVDERELYALIREWSATMEPSVRMVVERSSSAPPAEYQHQMGWVLIAFGNALWQLLHSENLEEGVVDTVMRGGDTDTNAAIAGALLGAVRGRTAIPQQWERAILNCRPKIGDPGVGQPRPEVFWPVDALELAEALLS